MVPDYQIPVTPLVEVLVRNHNIFWNINKIGKNNKKNKNAYHSLDPRLSDTNYSDSGSATRNFFIFLGYRQILGNKMTKNSKIVQKCGRYRFAGFRALECAWRKAFWQIDTNI